MDRKRIWLGICFVALAVSAAAQTNVTNGNNGTSGTVPVYNGAASVTNSPISVSGGNVGIGTTAPGDYLSIAGSNTNKVGIGIQNSSGAPTGLSLLTGGSTGFGIGGWANASVIEGESPNGLVLGSINAPGTAASGPITFQIDRSPVAVISTAGYFGIGTTSPTQSLEINGTVQIDAAASLFAPNNLGIYTASGSYYFRTGTPSSYADRLFIANAGNVGIGTTSPGAKLEVDGNVKLTAGSGASITFQDGTVQSSAYTGVLPGGDYADSVDVNGDRAKYEAGDLLIIDPDHPGKFLKSAESYSTSVAGIFSTKPGTLGRRQTGPKNPDEVPMAMVGIVPTKVSAENGAIHPGDLLVTGSMAGYAMKGTDRNRMLGAVVGKALGKLDSGTGVIEVVVTLQ